MTINEDFSEARDTAIEAIEEHFDEDFITEVEENRRYADEQSDSRGVYQDVEAYEDESDADDEWVEAIARARADAMQTKMRRLIDAANDAKPGDHYEIDSAADGGFSVSRFAESVGFDDDHENFWEVVGEYEFSHPA